MGVLITGMHRSGTSAVTELLAQAGLSLGKEAELIGPNPSQPRGHFEALNIVRINDDLMRMIGANWLGPSSVTTEALINFAGGTLGDQARHEMETHFPGDDWVIKDPRFCITLPFWREVLADDFLLVTCVRAPLDVATSLLRRDRLPVSYGIELWAAYNKTLFDSVQGLENFIVEFDDLIENPRDVAEALLSYVKAGTAIDLRRPSTVAKVVDQKLRRSQVHDGAKQTNPAVMAEFTKLAAMSRQPATAGTKLKYQPADALVDLGAYAGRLVDRVGRLVGDAERLETYVDEQNKLIEVLETERTRLAKELEAAANALGSAPGAEISAAHEAAMVQIKEGHERQLLDLNENFLASTEQLNRQHGAETDRLNDHYRSKVEDLTAQVLRLGDERNTTAGDHDREIARLLAGHNDDLSALRRSHEAALDQLAESYEGAMAQALTKAAREHELELDAERARGETAIAQALIGDQATHERALNEALDAERARGETAIAQALIDDQAIHERALNEALNSQEEAHRAAFTNAIASEQVKYQASLAESVATEQAAFTKTLALERTEHQQQLASAIAAEQARHQAELEGSLVQVNLQITEITAAHAATLATRDALHAEQSAEAQRVVRSLTAKLDELSGQAERLSELEVRLENFDQIQGDLASVSKKHNKLRKKHKRIARERTLLIDELNAERDGAEETLASLHESRAQLRHAQQHEAGASRQLNAITSSHGFKLTKAYWFVGRMVKKPFKALRHLRHPKRAARALAARVRKTPS